MLASVAIIIYSKVLKKEKGIYIYIYIYRERERERKKEIWWHIKYEKRKYSDDIFFKWNLPMF